MTTENRTAPSPGTTGSTAPTGYPFLLRLLHWLLWPSLAILILTGLSQHAVSSPDWSLWKGVLPSFFWSGRVHLYHTWAALVFAPAVLAALWIYLQRPVRFRATHVVLLGGGLALVVSGVLLMTWPGPPAVYLSARWVHFVVGLVVLPAGFIWHMVEGLTRYRRWLVPAFHPWARPRWMQLVYFVPVVLLTTCLVLNGLPLHSPWRDLVAEKIPLADVETKDLDNLRWDVAQPLRIELAGGIGFDGGRTQVTLWALHDGNELFVKAQWRDPTEDRRYTPWAKTADGWKHLVTDPDDESHYYEDKFSLIFPAQPDWQFERFGCALYCHAGTGPEAAAGKKYVGRHGDPKQEGTGYDKNVPKGEDKTHPAYLPRDPWTARHGMIPREHAVEYNSDEGGRILAAIPEGAIVPGIVASPAVGDRGDVPCTSKHDEGRWTLYLRRKLDTGHKPKDGRPSDVTFVPGRAHPFGCAAFDHSSKRHAYGFPVYRLVLE